MALFSRQTSRRVRLWQYRVVRTHWASPCRCPLEVGVRQGAINVSLFAGKVEVSDVDDDAQWSELDCRCERLGLV